MNDLISVIMGIKYVRDELNTLCRSIDSILEQTHTELELIICERGSSGPAKEKLAEYAAADSRIKLIDGTAAGSFSEQLNICLEHSSGKWIARMDDDDYSFVQRLEKQLEYLMTHTDISFVGCNVELIQDGKEAGAQLFPERPQARDFLFNMPYIHPALMFKREALEAANGYSTLARCERCEDYDLLLRLYEKGYCGANMQEILFAYSLPANGRTSRNLKDRINEMKTRYSRFKALGLLPRSILYVIKPLAVWLIPSGLLAALKAKRNVRVPKTDGQK